MAEMNKATVHASERVSARDMIQTQFEGDEDLSLMTDKDVAKIKKKAEKDERAARAALAAHQVGTQAKHLLLHPVCSTEHWVRYLPAQSLALCFHTSLGMHDRWLACYMVHLRGQEARRKHLQHTFWVLSKRLNRDGTQRQTCQPTPTSASLAAYSCWLTRRFHDKPSLVCMIRAP